MKKTRVRVWCVGCAGRRNLECLHQQDYGDIRLMMMYKAPLPEPTPSAVSLTVVGGKGVAAKQGAKIYATVVRFLLPGSAACDQLAHCPPPIVRHTARCHCARMARSMQKPPRRTPALSPTKRW